MQVTTGQHAFTYDFVFGEAGADARLLYPKCVAGLVDGLFKGYNATVFAYGQTGSGKTYTMGSEYKPHATASHGVIPEAINAIFNRVHAAKDWQCTVRVGFVEIHKVRGAEARGAAGSVHTRAPQPPAGRAPAHVAATCITRAHGLAPAPQQACTGLYGLMHAAPLRARPHPAGGGAGPAAHRARAPPHRDHP